MIPIDYDEVLRALGRASSPTERWLYLSALLAQAAGVPAEDFIIVGGSAIELHTSRQYTTGDVDIVSSQAERMKGILRGWGFEKEGRVWVSKDLGIVVDFVGTRYTGDLARTQILRTPFGAVRVAAIEDLIVKRLASAKHWKAAGDLDHAKLLIGVYRERLDWEYTLRLAREYDVFDLLNVLREGLSRS